MPRRSLVFPWLAAVTVLSCASSAEPVEPVEPASAFRLYTAEAGVYQVTYRDLEAAGLTGSPSSEMLSVWNLGEPVALWVEDGGDGTFDPGDRFEMVAPRLSGPNSYFHPYAQQNVFQLSFDRGAGARMTAREPGGDEGRPLQTVCTQHLEKDQLLIRLSGKEVDEEGDPESWYWAKLSHVGKKDFTVDLNLDGLDAGSTLPVELRLHLRGISEQRRSRPGGDPEATRLPDHAIEVRLGDTLVAEERWDGKGARTVELPTLEPSQARFQAKALSLRVPRRVPEGAENPIVDVVMINWVEATYPCRPQLDGGAVAVALTSPDGAAPGAGFAAMRGLSRTVAYGPQGVRVEAPFSVGGFPVEEGEANWWVAPVNELPSVDRIEPDRPSALASTDRQADYLMIAHPDLVLPLGPLVEHHRASGLSVEVIEIQDVYDEFNHGVVDPRAIRDFIDHAYHSWQAPTPRYVLLVGDASWDTKNATVDDANYANWSDRGLAAGERFKTKAGLPPAGAANDRNLIPTWSFHTPQGHAASDNYFVTVDGDDFYPDLAIGRFPVVWPSEVEAIVAKTLAYAREPEVGPWRARALWVTNENSAYQRRSDRFALKLGTQGLAGQKIYPSPEESDNQEHQETLLRAFEEGQLLVHFVGHGGRLIWRTGPPDLRKNHDLFTLDHLEELAPSQRLPVVLSMTCHSGPFDHPSADSIGEKFIRLEGRGAVAVVSASWRNAPVPHLSEALLERLARPGRIGDAFREAKQGQREQLVQLYNLFGDPAIPVAVPERSIQFEESEGTLAARIEAESFSGQALVEWLDSDGTVMESREVEVASPRFALPEVDLPEPQLVRVYAWDEAAGIDGLGSHLLREIDDRPVVRVRRAAGGD